VKKALDFLHLGDLLHLRLELIDLLGSLGLAAQPDDAVGRVHADLALVDRVVAEEHRFDLPRDGHVVERLGLRLPRRRLGLRPRLRAGRRLVAA
jgi:hypothetical protein